MSSGRMTDVVSGLAPELKGAKKGQGETPIASASERFTSYDVEAFEVPGGREENWRFTPLRRLHGLHDGSADLAGTAPITVPAGPGVTVETVQREDSRLGGAGVPADRVAAAAWSAFTEATVVTLDGAPAPVEVTVDGPGAGSTAAAHLHLRTTPHAAATVVVTYRGSGTLADNVEVVLAEGSRLTLVVIGEWADDAVHVGAQHLSIGRDATLRMTSVALGGDLVRTSPTVTYRGPGGDAELAGLGFADAGQHLEQRLLVDHAVPHCTSNVIYKNALQSTKGATAHTVWIGDVLIRAAAENTQHVRAQPQPGAHRARPRRLGAQPGDRDRRDRGRRATPAPPGGSTTSSCSTCRAGASRSTWRGGWSCAASSARSSPASPSPSCGNGWRQAIEAELAVTGV